MKKAFIGFSIGIASLSVLLIIFLATGLWKHFFNQQADEEAKTRIVTPRASDAFQTTDVNAVTEWEENLNTKIPLEDMETVIAVLNRESEAGLAEEQFVVYRTIYNNNQVFITFLSYDERERGYRRMWDIPVAASRTETITIFSHDLIGDRNNCIIITGMNSNNEHTMTVLRRSVNRALGQIYNKIAEIQIDGSIIIQETVRPLAYQQGITSAQSFNIAAYGQDRASANILDQVETIFTFNPVREQYEQTRVTKIPGTQVDQRRLRELLSGQAGVFENFINDLWYYITPQGTIDTSQFLYFDPAGKEVIFSGDGSQQIYQWQSSTPTRYGLNIRSQNISISTLLRFIDIELESLDRVRLRVTEDIRIRITATTTWDGSYRRAGAINIEETVSRLKPNIDAVYDCSWGRIQFDKTGKYSINSGGNTKNGHYVFYTVDKIDLIELRPDEGSENRMVYKIENVAEVMILSRVRLGTGGIQDLLEAPVTFTPVN